MAAAKVSAWNDLQGQLPEHVDLLPGQFDLLAAHETPLMYVRLSVRATADQPKQAGVNLFVCPACGKWGSTMAATPTTCVFGVQCPGKPAKVSAAKKVVA